MVTFTKTSFEAEDLTDAYLMQTYKGKEPLRVRKEILNNYKGIINTVEIHMEKSKYEETLRYPRSDRILLLVNTERIQRG